MKGFASMQPPVETFSPATVTLPGSLLPQTGDRFEATVQQLLVSGNRSLLLDCSELEQLYSGHVKLMWIARNLCKQHDASLRLVSVRPDVIRILKLLDLLEFFPFRISDADQGYAEAVGSTGESVRDALTGFEDYLRKIGAPETVMTDVRIIFYEITTNILNHGSLDPTEVIIVTAILTTSDSNRELIIRFTDNGIPFDSAQPQPRLIPEDAAAEGRTRGFGLMMVSRLADSISYERHRSTFNLITAIKRWAI
jgi:anti-sigma regulatory factor (Ser/Thr protein kinase)/anti-anti-sigma regulatory factor